MWSLFYDAASSAFIQVGSFVAITLFLFGYINFASGGKVIRAIQEKKKLQVLFGALLGLTPGCGGAILIMPLYLKGQVTFGTVVATLVATMGDAAFVLLTTLPKQFILVSLISLVTGVITGYTIDYFKIGSKLNTPISDIELKCNKMFQEEVTEFQDQNISSPISMGKLQTAVYFFRHHIGFVIFWIFAVLSLPLGIMNLLQIDFDNAFPIKNLGLIGFWGTIFSILYNLITQKILVDDVLPEVKSKQDSFRETLVHNAEETAFVIMWVFFALFAYEVLITYLNGQEFIDFIITKNGYLGVIGGLLVGLIPGCGPHIILTTLYIQGIIPFSVLVTNAISNDGDALFPLLAMDKRSAFFASLYSTIPAFIVGTTLYLLGF
ncbi:MAG: putative manganese transporter [Brevinema sp.]